MVTKNHQVQAFRSPFMDLARDLAMIIYSLEVTTRIFHRTVQYERSHKMSNLIMRKDEVGEMGNVEAEKGREDLAAEEHEDSEEDELNIGEDFHVDGGHGRDGDGGDRSEEEVQVMRT